MSFEVTNPFPVFTDTKGEPLENGKLFIGVVNLNPETNPVSVFFDASLTIPAAQPIRTIGGYPSRDGTPSDIFIAQNSHSITVRDKNDKFVFSDFGVVIVETAIIFKDTIADMTAILKSSLSNNQQISVGGFDIVGDGGGDLFFFDKDSTTPEDLGITFELDEGGTGRVIRIIDDFITVKMFDAPNDGTDGRVKVQAAVDFGAANNLPVYFINGVYGINPDPNGIALRFQANSEWFFRNAEVKLLAATGPIGGFISSPEVNPPSDLSKIRTDNVKIHDIVIDCDNIPGENAFGDFGSGLRLYNPTFKNIERSLTRLGGRAIQFEGDEIEDNHIYNPYFVDIKGIGINAQASNTDTTKVSRAITYHNVTMVNVDIPVNMDNTNESTPADVGDTRFMSTFITELACFNCGRPSWVGADPLEGAIITGDRGFGLRIDSLRVINTDTFGAINALVRGTMFNVQLNDVSMEAISMEAIFNLTNLSSPTWSASQINFQSTVYAKNVRYIRGNLDFVVKTKSGGGTLGACTFEDIQLDDSLATLTSAVDPNAALFSNALLELVDVRQGLTAGLRTTTGLLALSSIDSIGITDLLREQKQISKTAWPVLDISGGGLTLTSSDFLFEVHEGVIHAWVTIEYPATSDTNSVAITGLPLTPIALIGLFPIDTTIFQGRGAGLASKNFELLKEDGTVVQNVDLSGKTFHVKATYRI